MQKPTIPIDEQTRLDTLKSLHILDSEPQERFDRITRLARRLFGVPIALISLIDADRQWFLSAFGLEAKETSRDISFCGHAILGDVVFSIPDTALDPRFNDNPLVTDSPNIRFYAGCPISSPNGSKLGTICLIDQSPRNFTGEDIQLLNDLARIVEQEVTNATSIVMSQAAADEIKSLAFYDPLTLLPNRRLLLDRLRQALVSSTRNGEGGALLFLDLDHFKVLNDTLGHDVGDLLLQKVANRLTDCIREEDTVARIGGDEFVVLLEHLSVRTIEAVAQTKIIAQKIIIALNQPYLLNVNTYFNTSSIGATLFNGHEPGTEELLKQADVAMYQSKIEGRNTLRFFDPLMQEAITARADLERKLRNAIEQQEFQLYYQVQADWMGRPFGAEVLIRWQHPERGMILPNYFMPLVEETGLILPIGQWVLETACAQLENWQQGMLTKDLTLSVNVSARQFHQTEFVEQVLSTVNRYGINPNRLKLELTESILVHNINDIITKMSVLSKIGILFSLDDFGTGYSSLQYLKMLPLDQLKIDRSFVRDIATDSSDRAIVCTIISIASTLDINVIAEGVETDKQRQFLLDNGCSNYQGYLFSKPLPIGEFESLLRLS